MLKATKDRDFKNCPGNLFPQLTIPRGKTVLLMSSQNLLFLSKIVEFHVSTKFNSSINEEPVSISLVPWRIFTGSASILSHHMLLCNLRLFIVTQVTGRVLWLKPEGKAGRRSPSLKVLSLHHTNCCPKDHNYLSQQKHPETSESSSVNSSMSKGFEGPWVFGILSCIDSPVPVNVVELTLLHHRGH